MGRGVTARVAAAGKARRAGERRLGGVVDGAGDRLAVVHTFGHVAVVHEVEFGSLQPDAVEEVDDVVAVDFLLLDSVSAIRSIASRLLSISAYAVT